MNPFETPGVGGVGRPTGIAAELADRKRFL
jgi:hypothetical protein